MHVQLLTGYEKMCVVPFAPHSYLYPYSPTISVMIERRGWAIAALDVVICSDIAVERRQDRYRRKHAVQQYSCTHKIVRKTCVLFWNSSLEY